MAADENVLGALHDAVASALGIAMKGREVPGYTDPETGEVFPPTIIPPSAAEIQAATKFLKDNNITCKPAEGNALGELEQIMKDRIRKTASKADLRDASQHMGFLQSLPN
ncbi:hypothetical protein [Aquisediminimonas sediminicola]|uniref:hypothetical protein n=1 Tax=Alteraquisediminimonas sediminicola TaxID=2676787 RepID=UPI001C8D2E84|nr:hypothetical protein [Aquisediminimonas sediminicola]